MRDYRDLRHADHLGRAIKVTGEMANFIISWLVRRQSRDFVFAPWAVFEGLLRLFALYPHKKDTISRNFSLIANFVHCILVGSCICIYTAAYCTYVAHIHIRTLMIMCRGNWRFVLSLGLTRNRGEACGYDKCYAFT